MARPANKMSYGGVTCKCRGQDAASEAPQKHRFPRQRGIEKRKLGLTRLTNQDSP
jgi:hypothetical protein